LGLWPDPGWSANDSDAIDAAVAFLKGPAAATSAFIADGKLFFRLCISSVAG